MDNSTHNEHFEGYKRRADVPEEENKRMRPPLRDRTNDANVSLYDFCQFYLFI